MYVNTPACPMIDALGRRIEYLRLSVTDRCDLRCAYCMAEKMVFLPRRDLLTLEELDRLATIFITKGVRKLRITGGEPLVRRNIADLFARQSRHLAEGRLDELTLTTNGTQLASHADALARHGVRRINVSLDSIDPGIYARITRGGSLDRVLQGIAAAQSAGIRVKLNAVALKGDNADTLAGMIGWAHERDMDITLIEIMPMGEIAEDRFDQYIPLPEIRARLEQTLTLVPIRYRSGGPARYFRIRETGGRLGMITPLSNNFCQSCNRVRLTCTGRLYMCLGQEDMVDLRQIMRDHPGDDAPLSAAIDAAIARKPAGHDFVIDKARNASTLTRHMSVTGG